MKSCHPGTGKPTWSLSQGSPAPPGHIRPLDRCAQSSLLFPEYSLQLSVCLSLQECRLLNTSCSSLSLSVWHGLGHTVDLNKYLLNKWKGSRLHLVELLFLRGQEEEPKDTKQDWLEREHQGSTVAVEAKRRDTTREDQHLLSHHCLSLICYRLTQHPSLPC